MRLDFATQAWIEEQLGYEIEKDSYVIESYNEETNTLTLSLYPKGSLLLVECEINIVPTPTDNGQETK